MGDPERLRMSVCFGVWALQQLSFINCHFLADHTGVGRYVGLTPMWERTTCGIRAGELDISPVLGIGNTRTRLHSYG